jgi:uncharacterized protein YajQ (UPF0234 family)
MPSFDIVSKVAWNEVDNALQQTKQEIAQRYDFRDANPSIDKTEEGIVMRAATEDRVKAILDVFREKLVRRKVSLKHLQPGNVEPGPSMTSKLTAKIVEGIDTERARTLVKMVKDMKIKVQASIQEQQVRVTGGKRDDLQAVIQAIREAQFELELQFINFRD